MSLSTAANVMELLRRRWQQGSQPRQRDDDARIGLVIEGGGMRGVVAGGAVSALHDLRLTACFDDVYGASAGALSGAYLLAGAPALGTSIFFEDFPARDFINVRRLVSGQPVMGLDDLIDEVMVYHKPLDVTAVVDHPVRLHIAAACIDSHETVMLADGCLRERLRASARVPLLAGEAVTVGQRRLLDGCLFASLPTDRALADGCTHLVILRTKPHGPLRLRHPAVEALFAQRLLRAYPQLRGAPLLTAQRYARDIEALYRWNACQRGCELLMLAPPAYTSEISQSEMNASRLRRGRDIGYEMVWRQFGFARRQRACDVSLS